MTYDHWKTTNPADAELGNAEQPPRAVGRYRGHDIFRDEHGFKWAMADGFVLIEACRASIDHYCRPVTDRDWSRWQGLGPHGVKPHQRKGGVRF